MPVIDRSNRKYLILGLHGPEVNTVAGNVARVRMFIGEDQVDEDFPLPTTLTVEQQLDAMIQKRIAELDRSKK